MNQPTLHIGLTHLIEATGVIKRCPNVVIHSAYIPNEQDVLGAGILRLVKFRLLHPEAILLFLSFMAKEKLLAYDEFGVMQLTGTEFVQLPFDKEIIFQLAEKYIGTSLSVSSDDWRSFSEKVSKSLIQKRMLELMHGNMFPIGNKALNPLRLNCIGLLSFPNFKEGYMTLILNDFEALHKFNTIPEIVELLEWCGFCSNSDDEYLKNAFEFARQLRQLSTYSSHIDALKIISSIDGINDTFKQLQSN